MKQANGSAPDAIPYQVKCKACGHLDYYASPASPKTSVPEAIGYVHVQSLQDLLSGEHIVYLARCPGPMHSIPLYTGSAPVCSTCNGHGIIGGPSYSQPDEVAGTPAIKERLYTMAEMEQYGKAYADARDKRLAAPAQGANARPINQCDGCMAGHIIGQSGLHEYEGHGYMTCQAKRYVGADARPVGKIIANDPVHGWHMQPLVPWEEIGAETLLYATRDAETSDAPNAWADLWYFVMDEAPMEFERIVTTVSPKQWHSEAHKLMRAKYPITPTEKT